ncbi:hypothetical protein H8S75_13480 [Hungatella sp. L12]|uniref:YcxB-like protein domain-containing protein n=1 Tax=Hungatella hominis TaxID=2763050 RepID=A0ABR7H6Y5_9FIRM|nr:hypothetical protein [Hungatella hominis]MBC5708964.1 hypothetical protein [Hungatella hominis]
MVDQFKEKEGIRRFLLLRFRIGRLLTGIACIAAGAGMIIAFLLLARYDKIHTANTTPEPFDAFKKSKDCSVQIQMLAGPFASTQNDELNFYWGYGIMMEPVILLFRGELPESCQALLEYTQNFDTAASPEPVTLRGHSAAIEIAYLYDYALESYQAMWGLDSIELYEFKETVATCYLDTAELTWVKKLPWYATFLVYILPAVLLVMGVSTCWRYLIQKKWEYRKMSLLSEKEIQAAVQQLAGASEFKPRSRIYLTADFVITGNYQFDIIPYKRIAYFKETGGFFMAVTADDKTHIILSSGHKKLDRVPWLIPLEHVLEELIKDAKREGEQDAVISGN